MCWLVSHVAKQSTAREEVLARFSKSLIRAQLPPQRILFEEVLARFSLSLSRAQLPSSRGRHHACNYLACVGAERKSSTVW